MRFVAIIAATVGALAIAGTADDASAQARRAPTVSLTEAAAQSPNAPAATQRRGLRWNDSGRWGLNFNLNQPVGRETDWGDVEAGAYYPPQPAPAGRRRRRSGLARAGPGPLPESDRRAQPRVRLETIFKF